MEVKKDSLEDFNKPFPASLRALLDGASSKGKVSKTDLAKAFTDNGIPMTRQAISLYATGATKPDYEKFQFIAEYFGVSFDYLFGVSPIMNRENIDIAAKTGLGEKAIDNLILLKTLADRKREEEELREKGLNDRDLQLYRDEFKDENDFENMSKIISRLLEKDNIDKLTIPIMNYITSVKRLRSKYNAINFFKSMTYDTEAGVLFASQDEIPPDVTLEDIKKLTEQNTIQLDLEFDSIKDEINRAEWEMSKFLNKFAVAIADEIMGNIE